jgi:hypothetical protein
MSQCDRFTVVHESVIFQIRNLYDTPWWLKPTNFSGYYSSPGLRIVSVFCSYKIFIFLKFVVTNCHCFQPQCVLCKV